MINSRFKYKWTLSNVALSHFDSLSYHQEWIAKATRGICNSNWMQIALSCTWREFLRISLLIPSPTRRDYSFHHTRVTLKFLCCWKLMCIAFWFITSHIITNDRVERWCCVMYIILRSQQRVDSNSNDHSFSTRLVHIILGGLCCFWSTGSLQLVLVEACRKSSTNCEAQPPAHSGWECFVKLEESTRKFIPSQPSFNIQSEKTT